ncbi:MAG: glycosyltransferase family 4 protein [Cetobacterium sp.]
MKKILMIGAFPGQINGLSMANQTLYEGLKNKYHVDKINSFRDIGFEDKKDQGKFKIDKFSKILKELFQELKTIHKNRYDSIYITPGQSFLGYMRFSPYMAMAIIMKIPYYTHIHGGYIRKMYDNQSSLKKKILSYFFKKSAGVIVLGESLRTMFEGLIPEEKIFVCENGVQDEFVATKEEIKEKLQRYREEGKKRVLYLSNLMEEKGILDLLKASEKFSDEEIEFNLAGAIEPSLEKIVKEYLEKYPKKLKYHGIVRGEQKKRLLLENYIFILPTYYSNEGQPISILEAYTNGCAVITDESVGGITDIFNHDKNGLSCQNRDIENIYLSIKNIDEEKYIEENYGYGKEKFLKSSFVERVEKVIE